MKYKVLTDNKISKNKQYKLLLEKILDNHNWVQSENDFSYLFIIGGDGTFLSFVNQYLESSANVVFINSGKLGFYSYINDPKKLILDELLNENNFKSIDVIEIKHNSNIYKCVNDFSFYSNYTTGISILINNHLLEKIHGNGVLICTPFGSTARNKSLNGPIILPNTNVISITEIEPINNRYYSSLNSPIVLDNKYNIQLQTECYKKWWLLIDGKQFEFDEKQASIDINVNKSTCKVLIKTDDCNWIKKLNYAFIKNEEE